MVRGVGTIAVGALLLVALAGAAAVGMRFAPELTWGRLPPEGGVAEAAPTPPEVEPRPEVEPPAPIIKQLAEGPALEAVVAEAMIGFAGEYSVLVYDLESGERWERNPDRIYHPASTIKMPVALYALEQYRAGKANWNDLITYTPGDFESPGGGALETSPFGGRYSIENLVGRALRYSNNIAVNMLGRHFGWRNIEEWTTTIEGDLTRSPDKSPQVTSRSELGWWLHLHRVMQEDPKSAELLVQPLREVAYDGRITAGLPEGVAHLHKFGSYDGNYHDGGIIFSQRPYILVVMTAGAPVDEADMAIARVSAAVYQVMARPNL